MDTSKTQAVIDWPDPQSIKDFNVYGVTNCFGQAYCELIRDAVQ